MTKIKICGITNIEDALEACRLGADALGFVFADSPRRVEVKAARAIISDLPPFVLKVGVFVDATEDEIKQIVDECRLDAVQLHGEGLSATNLASNVRIIKVIRVREKADVGRAEALRADALLLDSRVPGLQGGTGVSFDWSLLGDADLKSPLILSGGLTPDNVEEAIARIRPYAVDISSGIEVQPGKKDHQKLRAFFEAVKRIDKRLVIGN